MARAEQWAWSHWGMATFYLWKEDVAWMVVVCFFGTKLTGWMLTWGVLKPGRLPTSSSFASKNVSPCVRPACFWPTSPLGVGTWSWAPGPRAARVPSPQLLLLGTAPLRDCGLARAAAGPMSPLGMPLLSLDPVLPGEATAPGLGVREQLPVVGPPSRDPCGGDTSRDGEEGWISHWISPHCWVQPGAATQGQARARLAAQPQGGKIL